MQEDWAYPGRFEWSESLEHHHASQWLFFQASGQGPYYGQLAWFTNYHPEKIPSAVERYKNEVNRVCRVLDTWLADKKWLVGEKMSYTDLSFVTWQKGVSKFEGVEAFPNLQRWMDRMRQLESVKKMYAKV